MSIEKLNKILEDINVRNKPTKDSLDKASVSLYRKSFYDYRDKRSDKNKYYLKGVQDALMVALGKSSFDKIKSRVKSDYTKDKID